MLHLIKLIITNTHYLFAAFLHLAGSFLLSSSLCLPLRNGTMMQFEQIHGGDRVPFTLPAGSHRESHGAVTDPIPLSKLGGKRTLLEVYFPTRSARQILP